MAKIVAVCWSEKKGTVKQPIAEGIIKEDFGLADDAHADCTSIRQVSLMSIESINRMASQGYPVVAGSFAENLTTEGIELPTLPIGTELCVGQDIILQVTQIGKQCHTGCAIFQQVGKCIMPKEGVFTKVIRGGKVKAGDDIKVKQKS
ncbi:MAG: MOSC domain-containing protein [Dehalococcoidales bacterium]|nr:MOSC domain-containing protein [Dehalococcoidales bacterium]